MKYTTRIVKFIFVVLAYLESIFAAQHAPQPLCLCCCTGEASDPDGTLSLHTSVLLDCDRLSFTKASSVEECHEYSLEAL